MKSFVNTIVFTFVIATVFAFNAEASVTKSDAKQDYDRMNAICENASNTNLRNVCGQIEQDYALQESYNIINNTYNPAQSADLLCPTSNENYSGPGKKNGARSLSPYAFKLTCKENRFPRCIREANCLCRHCINPANGARLDGGLISVPLKRFIGNFPNPRGSGTLPVQYTVGCTCAFPEHVSARK